MPPMTAHAAMAIAVGWMSLLADSGIPWPEHPRPDLERPAWLNLNGPWSFAFDPENLGQAEEWFIPGRHQFDRTIVVPFPWESPLSATAMSMFRGRLNLTVPAGFISTS